jgi:XTP/dITP diphosphohydrolase
LRRHFGLRKNPQSAAATAAGLDASSISHSFPFSSPAMTRLVIATRNAHKVREIQQILDEHFSICDLTSFENIPVVEESGATFEENAVLKAVCVSRSCADLVLADDSGLAVDALGGAPGVRSARFAGENATDQQNCAKLLASLGTERSARFICVLALAQRGNLLKTFAGSIEGTIASAPAGSNGFGYDPVFIPVGGTQTFAELSSEAKNRISHRSKALRQLRDYLFAQVIPPLMSTLPK